MPGARYEEGQCFTTWLYILLVGIAIVVIGGAMGTVGVNGVTLLIGAIHLTIILPILNLLFLRTSVGGGLLYIRFGYLFPMFWKRIPPFRHPGLPRHRIPPPFWTQGAGASAWEGSKDGSAGSTTPGAAAACSSKQPTSSSSWALKNLNGYRRL